MRSLFGLAAVAGAIVLLACGDDPPAAKYPSSDSFCAAKAAEECKAVGAICRVSDQVCTSARTEACKAAGAAAVGQGRAYDPTKAEQCIAKTTEVYKPRVIDPATETAFREACERVFAGSKKLSQPCSSLYDCEGTLVCDLEKGSVCASKVDKKKDEPCNNPGDTCGEDLFCQQQPGGSVRFCKERIKLGESCKLPELPCQDDLRCTTTCVPKVVSGQPCDTNDQCVTGLCAPDRKCSVREYPTETGTCKDFGGT
jgi:hypothetical protein